MKRFSEKVLDLKNLSLFNYFKNSTDCLSVWEIINHINELEVESLQYEFEEKNHEVKKIFEKLDIEDCDKTFKNWNRYILSQESEALFIFLFSSRDNFIDEFLEIKGKENLENILNSEDPVLFVSTHWGAFYSLPLILSALKISHIPVANSGEEDHLKNVLNLLVPEHKSMISDVLSTSNPIGLLNRIKKSIKIKQNILIYPEYTFGPIPKFRTTYFGIQFPAPRGVPKISVNETVKIQPVSLRRIPTKPKFEIAFYDSIVPDVYGNDVNIINDKIHEMIENIVRTDCSQWWYWEIFEKNSKVRRTVNEN